MNPYKSIRLKLRMARERNFGLKQILAVWGERKLYFQLMKNFRKLEGSWLRGLKKTLDVSSAVTRK
jgi:hypothetical protein